MNKLFLILSFIMLGAAHAGSVSIAECGRYLVTRDCADNVACERKKNYCQRQETSCQRFRAQSGNCESFAVRCDSMRGSQKRRCQQQEIVCQETSENCANLERSIRNARYERLVQEIEDTNLSDSDPLSGIDDIL